MPDAPMLNFVKDNDLPRRDDNEQPKNLLSREAFMLGGGIKDGFMDRLNQAKEHPGLTALEFTGAAVVGAGLAAMSQAGGRWGMAAKVGTAVLQAAAVTDIAFRVAPTAYAMGDTALNPDHYLKNRAIVADNIGTACFDYPLMAAGAMLGSSAMNFTPRAISSSLSDQLSAKSAPHDSLPTSLGEISSGRTAPNSFGEINSRFDFAQMPKTYSDIAVQTRVQNIIFPVLWSSQTETKFEIQKK